MSRQKSTDVMWAAGLFEGEGCISINKRHGRSYPCVHLKSTDRDTVERFYNIVGVGTFRGPYKQRVDGHSDYWTWCVQNLDGAAAVINMLWPGLMSRRRERALEVMDECFKSSARADKRYGSKLSEEQAEAIRRIHAESGRSQKSISREFGVTQGAISRILSGKAWGLPRLEEAGV